MKYVFFVTTIGSISEVILPLIEERKNKGEILIIVATTEAELFFKNHTNFEIIRMKVHPNLITQKTRFKIFSNIICSKIEYKKLFGNIENCEIYFFGHSFSLVIYSYVRKLSKKNKVFHWGGPLSEDSPNQYPVENSLRSFFMRWIAKWLMGVQIVIRNKRGNPFWSIDEKFYENTSIEILEKKFVKKKSVESYMMKMHILKGKKILIAIEDSIKAGTIEESEFIKKIDIFIGILNDIVPGEYIIKPHPRLNKLYGKMSECKEIIPAYIPFEFILNHKWKTVIGINSAALLSATRDTNAKVISLMDAIKFKNEKDKNMFRNWLKKETSREIMFPSDMIELRKLLEG